MERFLEALNTTFVNDEKMRGYCLKVPFDPPMRYQELPFALEIDSHNMLYALMRELLARLGLDAENEGTPGWNPFKDIIKPGDKVLIKPNLVTDRHYLGKESLYGSIVHGSVLRPLVDYAYLALGGEGSITIADNPVEGADFELIMEFTGIRAMVDELSKRGYKGLRVLDLRPRVLKESRDGKFFHRTQPGDPLGYINIDLGKKSLFAEFDDKPDIHYYTLADRSVDHIDPRFKGGSKTDEYHNPSSHRYIISKTVLDSDVIINVAKMKTHCKAGMSLALKNMIGMVYEKDCMPHHRPGMPPDGDAFPYFPAKHYVASRKLYSSLREWFQIPRLPGFRSFRNWLQKNKILVGQHIEHGNWKGNDTIWRTILDLNRIAFYADREGIMRDEPQRKFFGLIDGIISQEGDGPMNGWPVHSSVLIGGHNPVAVDALALKMAGFGPEMVKTVNKAAELDGWKISPDDDFDKILDGLKIPELKFELPNGWN
jgi:uncharacterized protein (DUF362 family)